MPSNEPLTLGIMTRHVERPTIEEVATAIAGYGLGAVQLSLESAGLDPLPARVPADVARRIVEACARAGIKISAVSGTFNMIDPDRERLAVNLVNFQALCAACESLGTRVITICTGTRDPNSMWRAHPDNQSQDAWDEMVERCAKMARIAEEAGVIIAFEPETANVVDSTAKAAQLIHTINSPSLGVTFDPANFFYPQDLPHMQRVLVEGFERLTPYIALTHAKDVVAPPAGHSHCRYAPAGRGLLDYEMYLRILRRTTYDNGLIMHSLSEADIPGCMAHIRRAELRFSPNARSPR